MDFLKQSIEEIALEGLDGSTISTFWFRLENRNDFIIKLDDKSKAFLWNCLVPQKCLEFYELPKPRPAVILFNRYENIDPETGIVIELVDLPEDPYPINIIKNKIEKGSCETYDVRKLITNDIRSKETLQPLVTLNEAIDRWGENLVIVASQTLRTLALLGPEIGLKLDFEMSDIQYCILERLGRSRYMGETTLGARSLAQFGETPKSMFYYRKILLKRNLITKQNYFQRSSNGQSTNGKILHLKHFYVEIPSKTFILLENICDILSKKKDNMECLVSVKSELGLKDSTFKKLYQLFSNYLKIIPVLYRDLYPEASEKEYKSKNGNEKIIRVIKMIQTFNRLDFKDDDDDKIVHSGICNSNRVTVNESLLRQTVIEIEKKGPEGASQNELSQILGLTRLEGRLLTRNLERKKSVRSIMKDEGRQRVKKFVAITLEKKSKLHNQFEAERKKILELTKENPRPTMKDADLASATGNVGPETDESNSFLDVSQVDDGNLSFESKNDIQKKNSLLQQLHGVTPDFSFSSGYVTYRMLKRACLIIEAVREAKLIDTIFTLQKLIIQEEVKEGYNKRIDKKSMLRLVQKLVEDGQLKVLRLKLKLGDMNKKLFFICDPGLKTTDPLVLSAIEQAKFKHFAVSKEVLKKKSEIKKKEDKKNTKETCISMKKSSQVSRPEAKMEYMPKMGKIYGLEAKMPRLKIMHKILFYLVYKFKDNNNDLGDSEELIVNEISSQTPRIYLENKSWKMFMPPLPIHADFGPGWCLISDVLLRLPLSLFCKCVNITYKIEGLAEYLEDPIKQHYLIQHLPSDLRQALLYTRKYIFSMHDIITRLCYMGLVSFGPQQHKEKDQVFIYLHKNASLLDTTISEPHYYLISENVMYKEENYYFQSETDLDQYWFDLESICLNTPLGYAHAKPTSITMDKFPNIKSLLDFATQKIPDNMEDNGKIPGDHRGAAGLDSTFFGHLNRNWCRMLRSLPINKLHQSLKNEPEISIVNDGSCQTVQQSAGIYSNLPLDKKKRLPRLLKSTRVTLYQPTTSTQAGGNDSAPSLPEVVKVTMENIRKGMKRKNRKQNVQKPKKKEKKVSTRVRTIKRRQKKIQKPYTDEKDQMVLSTLTKERVTWSAQEDSFLLLCKVASSVLDNHQKSIIVPWTVVRDIVHENVKDSKDKTSKACQRRVSYVLKNPQTSLNVRTFVGEAMQDKKLVQKYCSKKFKFTDEQENGQVFRSLVNELKIKFGNPVNSGPQRFPASIEELDDKYCILFSGLKKEIPMYSDVKNVVDIHCSVLHNAILSSLHNPEKSGCSYQLYKLFKQYPDNMLRSVLMQMRKTKLISQHKGFFHKKIRSLPFSSIQFHLSCSYRQSFLSRYQCSIFSESFAFLQRLKNEENGCSLYSCDRGSQCATIVTLMALNMLCFNITLPEEVIKVDQHHSSSVRRGLVLDPKVFDSSFTKETITENAMQLENSEVQNNREIRECSFARINDDSTSTLNANIDQRENKKLIVESESIKSPETSILWETRNASHLALFILRQQSMAKPHPRFLKVYDSIAINSALVVANLHNDRDMESEVLIPINVLHDIFNKAQLKQPLKTISITECEKLFDSEEYFNDVERQHLIIIYQYINQQKELGVVYLQLKNYFESLPVMNYLMVLLKHQMVLQVGVSVIRYVSQEYAQPWLIHSFKIQRDKAYLLHTSTELKNYEISIDFNKEPVEGQQTEIDMEIEVGKEHLQKVIHIDLTKESMEAQPTQTDMEIVVVEGLESLSSLKNSQVGNKTTDRTETIISNTVTNLEALEINKDEIAFTSQGNTKESTGIEKSKKENKDLEDKPLKRIKKKKVLFPELKKFDIESILEPVNLVPRPWRKPNGTLNKHVLQNQIEGILMYIMMKPGITQKNILKHFNPVLQPVVLFELLEMLHVIKCITITYLKLPPKTTLFSPISIIQKGSCDDEMTETCYEPTIDCIIKLGHMFSSIKS